MKKNILLLAVTFLLLNISQVSAKTYVGVQGGFADRVFTNQSLNQDFHYLGGFFELNYSGINRNMGKKAEVSLDVFVTYVGTTSTIKVLSYPAYKESWHMLGAGFGPIFTFELSKLLDLYFKADIGVGLDIATSNSSLGSSGKGKNILWRVALGIDFKINKKIGIPLEFGYLGTYTLAEPEDVLMHGLQVSSGVKFYLGL